MGAVVLIQFMLSLSKQRGGEWLFVAWGLFVKNVSVLGYSITGGGGRG